MAIGIQEDDQLDDATRAFEESPCSPRQAVRGLSRALGSGAQPQVGVVQE